ncbi:MAG: OB-fold domain-containing protein [Ilumatobacteraceae bacterium]
MTDTAAATSQVPLVDYLVLGDRPHLVAHQCTSCGARFFDRRNACASCFATSFEDADIATDGTVRAFTIVTFAAPGVPVPFASAIVDCAGTSVRGNIVNTPADPEHITLGMAVRLTTYSLGTDDNGTEAIGFGFEPA